MQVYAYDDSVGGQFRYNSSTDAATTQTGLGSVPQKLRIRRVGTTMYCDYYDGTWNNITSKDYTTRVGNLTAITLYADTNATHGGSCDVDDLLFTTGCPFYCDYDDRFDSGVTLWQKSPGDGTITTVSNQMKFDVPEDTPNAEAFATYKYSIPSGDFIVDIDLPLYNSDDVSYGPYFYFTTRDGVSENTYTEIRFHQTDTTDWDVRANHYYSATDHITTKNPTTKRPTRFRIKRDGTTLYAYYYNQQALSVGEWELVSSEAMGASAADIVEVLVKLQAHYDDVEEAWEGGDATIDNLMFREGCPDGTPRWTTTSTTTTSSSTSSTASTLSTTSTTHSTTSTTTTLTTTSSSSTSTTSSSTTTTTYWCEYNDRFEDIDAWLVTYTKHGGETATLNNERIRLDLPDSQDTVIEVQYQYLVASGDADIRIDLPTYTPDSTNDGFYAQLRFHSSDNNDLVQTMIRQDADGANTWWAGANATINTVFSGTTFLYPAGRPTKLRIVRDGDDIKAYYYYNGSWTLIQTYDFTGTSANLDRVLIRAFDVNTRGGYVDFDNLIFADGCPSGYPKAWTTTTSTITTTTTTSPP